MNLYNTELCGLNMKLCRMKLGLTQKELAEVLDCSQQVISQIENGIAFSQYFYKYLVFLHSKNFDINAIFE